MLNNEKNNQLMLLKLCSKIFVLSIIGMLIAQQLLAAEIVITNCYDHWRKPSSVHVCVLNDGEDMNSAIAHEVDFSKVNERQFLVCETEHCKLLFGIGYCEADVNNIKNGQKDKAETGQYLIQLKRQQLVLTEGNACPR